MFGLLESVFQRFAALPREGMSKKGGLAGHRDIALKWRSDSASTLAEIRILATIFACVQASFRGP
jgi:hypothetical protein